MILHYDIARPKRKLTLASHWRQANRYNRSCHLTKPAHRKTIRRLMLMPGETVSDVAFPVLGC